MNAHAHKFLIERLNDLKWSKISLPKDPPEIRALRRKLYQHDHKVRAVMKARERRFLAGYATVGEMVFAGDYEKALAALKRFEQQTF